jgi:hypothetical protein
VSLIGISKAELAKLPYVKYLPQDGRIVPLGTFFDSKAKNWHLYVPHDDKSLIRILDGEVIFGSYLGHDIANPSSDIEFPLGTLVIQHLSFPQTLEALGKLENDIHCCAAILQKYHLMWSQRHDKNLSARLLVESELEYLLLLLRSLYDLLQSLVANICSRLVPADERSRRAMKKLLPRSFAGMVLTGNEPKEIRDADDLVTKYGMPEPLALWYHTEATFFQALRKLRDGIAHHGHVPPTVLETEWGFAIMPSEPPWNRFTEWPEEKRLQGLGSLRSVFAGFIAYALGATTRFATTIPTFLQLAPALGDKLHLFVRNPFGHQLVMLEAMRNQPWEGKDIPMAPAGELTA